jgi:hypothetical protein
LFQPIRCLSLIKLQAGDLDRLPDEADLERFRVRRAMPPAQLQGQGGFRVGGLQWAQDAASRE